MEEALKLALVAMLMADGQKQINKDDNDRGADDVRGQVQIEAAKALSKIDFKNISKDKLEIIASSLESAAVVIRSQIKKL